MSIVRPAAGEPIASALDAYQARPDVVYAELNRRRTAFDLSDPNDPMLASQWALPTIHAVQGWSLFPGAYVTAGGAPLAVVDIGVTAAHEDLTGHVRTDLGAKCFDPSPCVSDPATDDEGHGTHVAGIAAAATNNGVGVAGLAFSSPTIPVKVLDSTGAGWDSDIANGIVWAAQKGARGINLSLGGAGYSQTLCDAVTTAIAG